MLLIGLTGGVGTGKSTVARMFAGLGARVLDADRITHELMAPGTAVSSAIRARFGRQVMAADGRVDRKKLGALAFASAAKLQALTRIIHPAVRAEIHRRLRRIRRENPGAVVVLEIPLLFETRVPYRTDATVVVTAPAAVAAKRLKRRSGWSAAEVRRRSSFQMPLREKENQADFVVQNGGRIVSTRRQVMEIWKTLGEGIHVGRKNG